VILMAVVQPYEMNFSDKKFSMIISGSPGIGKTTLALSAPNPVLIDFDKGISRVNAQHRKTTIVSDTYEEILKDLNTPEVAAAETIIIDTGGSLISYLQDWAMRSNPSTNKLKNGSISRIGYGVVATEFNHFTERLKVAMNKNVIYIFHTVEEKDRDTVKQRLLCEGKARNTVWQPCDLGCYMQMAGEERILGFTPTEEYFAKGCYGISGTRKIPNLGANTPNDFLTRLFEEARKNIADESKVFEKDKEQYDAAMKEVSLIIETIKDAETANRAAEAMKGVKHALTSNRESRALFRAKLSELGLVYNKEAGTYELPDNAEPIE